MNIFLLFLAGVLTDSSFGLWTSNVVKQNYLLSMLFTTLTGICAIFLTYEIINYGVYVCASWIAGLNVGTILAIKIQKWINVRYK